MKIHTLLLPLLAWQGMAVQAAPEEAILKKALVIRPVGYHGRVALHSDALEAQMVAGRWAAPKAGDALALPDGATRAWEEAEAGRDGWFESRALQGGYAYLSLESSIRRVALLEALGHNMAYVNGEPRGGDMYAYGYVRLPVLLKPGTNHFLFHCQQGRLLVRLIEPKPTAMLDVRDSTLPDLISGQKTDTWGAVVVINTTEEPLGNLVLSAACGSAPAVRTRLPVVAPLGMRKVGFRLKGSAPAGEAACKVALRLTQGKKEADSASLDLRVRRAGQTYKTTFLSRMDGSVQYYAVNPMQPPYPNGLRPAVFLTLHGASVEAIGQADAYASKTWGYLVAPTNRRPYGLDWEDWGQLDAIEVLDMAARRFRADPARAYLTGHSMGGHGTWHVGQTYPDRFAAIGPSAGWLSFWSYRGTPRNSQPTDMDEMLARGLNPSDTLSLAPNYARQGVYVLQGDADDNVPVTEARAMKERLTPFHRDFEYFEQPGAGHWWDSSDEPGADCVDWPQMFDFFARHALPSRESLRQVDFITANPGLSSRCYWAEIEVQTHPLKMSSISLRYDPHLRRFTGKTENVLRLTLDVAHILPGRPFRVEIDGQKLADIPWPKAKRLWLARQGEQWAATGPALPDMKGPHRYGPFKMAFLNRPLFLYGTQGTPEENAWAFAKARFDAESFWYRANVSVDVLPDTAFDPKADPDRNIILYGNADTNRAWNVLLPDSPVEARRGLVRIADREYRGDDLACLFLRPRPGSDSASVGAVAGSGLSGMRLTDRLPYFLAGVSYPDCIVMGPEALFRGSAGVRAAGYFGSDWSVEKGEFVWGQSQ
ncbi:MAG: prolyl oligopeptidase family serine peptidase [Armatimonadetes bacterium]|nr:prolyl oligopeptidase family serine peptidase [Armatimonadota bacterium]